MLAVFQGRAGHYALLLAAGLVLFMNNLGGPTLWDLDEGRNATAALEMLETGNFIVPTFNAQLRADKPVLLYWLQIASIQLFGINEFAVRLPSALAALGTLFSCYELGRALFCPSTALLAGLVLGSTTMMTAAGRFANPDALLNFFIVIMLTLFWRGHARPQSRWFVGMGVLLGLAALTKGPVGVLLPCLVVGTFLVWNKQLALLWDRRLWQGLLAFALVALPWYVGVAIATRGSFLLGFLGEHNLTRFLQPMGHHTGSPFYYLVVLLVGTAPWSIFVVFASWYGIRSMIRANSACAEQWPRHAGQVATSGTAQGDRAEENVAAYRFLWAWLACYFVFFSIAATKLPNYLLPAAVPLALLAARFIDRWRRGDIRPRPWVMLTCLACLAGTGVATWLALTLVAGKFSSSTFPMADAGVRALTASFASGLKTWALFGFVPLAASLAACWSWRRRRPTAAVICLVTGVLLFLGPLIAWAPAAWNRIKAPRALVEASGALARERDIRIGGYQLEHLPSLNFYTRREVSHQPNEADALAFLRYQVPVYLFLPARYWDTLKAKAPAGCRLVAHHPDLYCSSDIVVVTNFPCSEP